MRDLYAREEKNFQQVNQAILHDMKVRQNWYYYNEDKAKRVFDKQVTAAASYKSKVIDIEDYAMHEKILKM